MRTAKVIVLPYDAAWADAFQAISDEIRRALGELALGIEHVGSTSVPGMSAKPCIDLDVVIRDDSVLPDVIGKLAAAGYIHEGDLGIPGREAFCYTGKQHLMKHHLYVCPEMSEELHRHITFRDYLRTHPAAAAQYSSVKEQAAQLFPDDNDRYMAYKAPCIKELYALCGLDA